MIEKVLQTKFDPAIFSHVHYIQSLETVFLLTSEVKAG